MIVSDEHRYLFVELPHTASTAIAGELTAHYGGRPILHKHARHHQFLAAATTEQRRYFVFSGIRNPLDEAVTYYFRYQTDHLGRYSDPAKWKVNGGSVSDRSVAQYLFLRDTGADFPTYLRRFYTKPYDNWSNLAHRSFPYLIRFERLQEGFAAVLDRLGLAPARPLPVANKTADRRTSWWEYYPPDLRPYAARIFGPFLQDWGYEFPAEWGPQRVPLGSEMLYRLLKPVRRWRWTARGEKLFD